MAHYSVFALLLWFPINTVVEKIMILQYFVDDHQRSVHGLPVNASSVRYDRSWLVGFLLRDAACGYTICPQTPELFC
jgi:hypothetical protein